MALETGNYVGDLNVANPAAADPKSQGDDHLRLIKLVLRQSFPGFTGAIVVTGANGGVANSYTLTPIEPLLAYITPMLVVFAPLANNTTASNLNISGLGAVSIIRVDGAALSAADLVLGSLYMAVYDGAAFRLLSPDKAYVDALRTYVDQLAFQTALPNQAGAAGKVVTTDGVNTSWLQLTSANLSDTAARDAAALGVAVALAVAL